MSGVSEPGFDAVEDAHEEARRLHGFGRFGYVVVVDFSVSGRVPEDGVCAGEECACAFLFAFLRGAIGQRVQCGNGESAQPSRFGGTGSNMLTLSGRLLTGGLLVRVQPGELSSQTPGARQRGCSRS